MIIELLKEKKNFTPSEIQISDYILNNMAKVLELTVEELALETYTSKASVIRLCKKLDVKGYRDFLRKIEHDLNEIYRMSYLINKEPIHQKSSLHDIVNIIPSIYETAVSQTKLLLNYNVINRVIHKMKQADLIEIYGIGISETVARAAAFKFNSIGITSIAFDGLNEHYIMSHKSNKNKVAILLTFSGYNPYIIKIAQYLKHCDYYIIGIGGNEHEELESLCSEFIEIYTKEMILTFEMLTSYTATNYILDILFARLLSLDYEKNIEVSMEVLKQKNRNY